MAKGYRQLSLYDRQDIERGLDERKGFSEIARAIGRSASTVSREVRQNRTPPAGKPRLVPCGMAASCARTGACEGGCRSPHTLCRDCAAVDCRKACADYRTHGSCDRVMGPPWVCNGCPRVRRGCRRPSRMVYRARVADEFARRRRSESRQGVDMEKETFLAKVSVIEDALKRGMSPYEISVAYAEVLGLSPSTIYRWVERGLGGLMSIDLERKVRFRPRKRHAPKKSTSHSKRRSHGAFLALAEEVRAARCEMDTVIGRATDRQAILTLYTLPSHVQLALLLREKTCAYVKRVLRALKGVCDPELFCALFDPTLTDNGEEFSDEAGIGKILGERGSGDTRLFYCDPRQSQQKGGCEKNHTELRQILKKGLLIFDELTEADLAVAMSHANSNPRASLGGRSPLELFLFLHGEEGQALMDALGVRLVGPDGLMLKPDILDIERERRGEPPLTRLR